MENTSALGAIKRRWWVIALLTLVGGAVGALPQAERVEEQTSTFRATHTMLVNDAETAQFGASAVSPNQVPLLATVGEVPKRVAEELEFAGNPAALASQVTVEFDFATGALRFTTSQDDPARAEELVDAFADTTNSYLQERQDAVYQDRLAASLVRLAELETELGTITGQLNADPENPALQARQNAISRQYSVAFEQNRVLEEAPPILGLTSLERGQAVEVVERGLSAPTSREARGLLGAAVGLALGVLIAVVLGRLDRKIRSREQAEAVLGTRTRAIVPKSRDPKRDRLVVASGRHDALSDSYRTIRNVVGFVQNTLEPVDRARVTLVASPGPGDGKTSLATNLAAAFVETGKRTIIVNTDFRRPRLARAVAETPPPAHPFVLEDLDVLAPKSLLQRTDMPGLLILDLSTIDATAGDLVRATAAMMPALAEICDEIVIDTSPVGATAEVLEMVPYADVILTSVRLGHTSIPAARRTMAVLRDVTTAPILLVVNSVKQERAPYYEYTDRRTGDDAPSGGGLRSRLRPGRKGSKDLERVG